MCEHLIPASGSGEFATRERCFITEVLNDPRAPQVSLARCRVEPGVTTELHSLSVDEVYLVTAGRGVMEVGGGDPFEVAPGDAVTIPAGAAQRIRNPGPGELRFDCLCTPRFTPEAYHALEE